MKKFTPSPASGMRRFRWCAAAVTLVVAGGCDYMCGIERRAEFPGADVARVRAALEADPTLSVTDPPRTGGLVRIGGPDESETLWCRRDSLTANVNVTRGPDEIRVHVGSFNRGPAPGEVERWRDLAEGVCRTLDSDLPEIGSWEVRESLEPPGLADLAVLVAALALLAAFAGFGAFVVARVSRALRRRAGT